ncbi:hypothetical protein C8J56DRAFT_1063702 [Mycena floridula]|nr:hypothetical protein C8J56DRAFT_1063702 [Mycena floridula]
MPRIGSISPPPKTKTKRKIDTEKATVEGWRWTDEGDMTAVMTAKIPACIEAARAGHLATFIKQETETFFNKFPVSDRFFGGRPRESLSCEEQRRWEELYKKDKGSLSSSFHWFARDTKRLRTMAARGGRNLHHIQELKGRGCAYTIEETWALHFKPLDAEWNEAYKKAKALLPGNENKSARMKLYRSMRKDAVRNLSPTVMAALEAKHNEVVAEKARMKQASEMQKATGVIAFTGEDRKDFVSGLHTFLAEVMVYVNVVVDYKILCLLGGRNAEGVKEVKGLHQGTDRYGRTFKESYPGYYDNVVTPFVSFIGDCFDESPAPAPREGADSVATDLCEPGPEADMDAGENQAASGSSVQFDAGMSVNHAPSGENQNGPSSTFINFPDTHRRASAEPRTVNGVSPVYSGLENNGAQNLIAPRPEQAAQFPTFANLMGAPNFYHSQPPTALEPGQNEQPPRFPQLPPEILAKHPQFPRPPSILQNYFASSQNQLLPAHQIPPSNPIPAHTAELSTVPEPDDSPSTKLGSDASSAPGYVTELDSTAHEPDNFAIPESDDSAVAEPDDFAVAEPDDSAVAEPDDFTIPESDDSAVAEPDDFAVAGPWWVRRYRRGSGDSDNSTAGGRIRCWAAKKDEKATS